MTKNGVELNDVVKEEFQVKESKYNGRYTKTALFLLPMLGLSIRNRLLIKYLRNAFLDDMGVEHDFVRPLFLLLCVKNKKERDWQELERLILNGKILKELSITNYYVGVDAKTGGDLIMYVFQVPDKWMEDFYLFKKGKYSKMSKEYKEKFPKEVLNSSGKSVESIVWGALYKSPALKDMVAREFVPKDDKGNILDKDSYKSLRKDLDDAEEIWDLPKKEEEIYRYKEQI